MNIKVLRDGEIADYKSFLFPAGEVGVKFDPTFKPTDTVEIWARITSSREQVEIALIKDAIQRNWHPNKIYLVLTYLPYARQDRVCDTGESFSLKVFADYINSLDFYGVTVFDPHSNVAEACINKLSVIDQLHIVSEFEMLNTHIGERKPTFVSPDAGGNKKTSVLASYFNHSEFIRADKLRDLSTGKIKETVVYANDLGGRDVIIADDICDGGATFLALAAALKKKNCGKVSLYVTHGIFSKGFDILFNGGIDYIYCTNSFKDIDDTRVYTHKIF